MRAHGSFRMVFRGGRCPAAAVLLLAAGLPGACAGPTGPGAASGPVGFAAERPVPAPGRLQIDQVRLSHAVRFVPGGAGPAPGEPARLEAFLDAVRPRPADRVTLAATAPAAAARLGLLRAALAARGLEADAAVPVAAGGDVGVISVERPVVLPAACLADGGQAVPDGGMLPGPGCANALNLARMVADPADLLHGRPAGPADGAAAVRAIERYRRGQVTPLISETASGKVEVSGGAAAGGGGGSGSTP